MVLSTLYSFDTLLMATFVCRNIVSIGGVFQCLEFLFMAHYTVLISMAPYVIFTSMTSYTALSTSLGKIKEMPCHCVYAIALYLSIHPVLFVSHCQQHIAVDGISNLAI